MTGRYEAGAGVALFRRRAALLLLLLASVVFAARSYAERGAPSARPAGAGDGCAARPLGRLPVATLDDAPFVTLLANGHPITLLLDTGAERTTLTPDAAARIKAQPPRIAFDRRMQGLAGTLAAHEVEFDSFTADAMAIPWRRAVVAPVTLSQPFGLRLDGLLGADVLSQFDSDLDLAHQQLSFYQTRSCPDGPPWAGAYSVFNTGVSRGEHLFFRVRLDNRDLVAIIDTGSQRTTVSVTAAQRLGVTAAALENDRPLTTRGAANERLPARLHRFRELQIGSEIVRDPEFVVTNANFADADIILGTDFLKTRRIWLSYAALQIFLSRNLR